MPHRDIQDDRTPLVAKSSAMCASATNGITAVSFLDILQGGVGLGWTGKPANRGKDFPKEATWRTASRLQFCTRQAGVYC